MIVSTIKSKVIKAERLKLSIREWKLNGKVSCLHWEW